MTLLTQAVLKNSDLFLQEAGEQRNSITNAGLLNGHTGIAIVYYLLAKHTGDKVLAEEGLQLLDWISETGVSSGDLSFANGLTGIGWAIEWLAQQDLIDDIDTDEILEPIDSVLYGAVSYIRDDNPTLSNGALGKFAYFLRRNLSNNPNTNRFKTIGQLECIVLLLDDLAEKMGQVLTDNGDGSISIATLGELLVVISAIKVKVNSPTTGKLLYDSVNTIERILSGLDKQDEKNNYFELLYVAICYLIAAKNRGHKFWEAQALQYIESLVAVTDQRAGLTEEQLFQKLTLYSLLAIHVPGPHYRQEAERLIAILSRVELPPVLFNGRGGLVVAELCLTNPGLVQEWHELMFFSAVI